MFLTVIYPICLDQEKEQLLKKEKRFSWNQKQKIPRLDADDDAEQSSSETANEVITSGPRESQTQGLSVVSVSGSVSASKRKIGAHEKSSVSLDLMSDVIPSTSKVPIDRSVNVTDRSETGSESDPDLADSGKQDMTRRLDWTKTY